jgi:ribose-phosphate pyrophosphokinase
MRRPQFRNIFSPLILQGSTMDGLAVPSHGLKLLSGTANRPLAEEIAKNLGVELCRVNLGRFADGEIAVRIDENVRGNDVFIVQPTNPPAENIMELLLLIDAARRASAARITCVMPYYGYARQDRKDQPRVPIGAKLMANMITASGVDRVLGVDFHQHQLQGFFDVPVDHLYAMPVFTAHYRKMGLIDPVVVAPDVGSAKMARGFAKRLNASLAIIDKRRPRPNVSEVVNVVGDVAGHDCILVDDMIDTAGTVTEAARALKELGAKDIYICATHALLSGPAVKRLNDAPIKELAVTDTIMIPEEKRPKNLFLLSVGELLSKAIRFTHSEQSVSSLFD